MTEFNKIITMAPVTSGKGRSPRCGMRTNHPTSAAFVIIAAFGLLPLLHFVSAEITAGKTPLGTDKSGYVNEDFLPVDMSGFWEGHKTDNCMGYVAGLMVFQGRATDLNSLDMEEFAKEVDHRCIIPTGVSLHHFQDCLRMTVTNGGLVHHTVMDGEYVTESYIGPKPVAWQTAIEEPQQHELDDGAQSVVVMYMYNTTTQERVGPPDGFTRRYINRDGNMILTKELYRAGKHDQHVIPTKGSWILYRAHDYYECDPYDSGSDRCSDYEYTEDADGWTVACCEKMGGDDYFESLLVVPRPRVYRRHGFRAPGREDCDTDLPPPDRLDNIFSN